MDTGNDPYPLHTAARLTQLQALDSLLTTPTQRKQLLVPDSDGRLPLHWACTTTSLPLITTIIDSTPRSSFDIDATDSSGWTPLMIASSLPSSSGLPTIELLLSHAADPKLPSTSGATALHFAVSKNNIDVVRRLLSAGASARIKDKRGQLPIHRAAAAGNVPMTKLLLGQGKSPLDAADGDGLTPLAHAISEGHGDVAVELLKAGADSGRRDRDGVLPIDLSPDGTVRMYVLRGAEMEGVDVIEK